MLFRGARWVMDKGEVAVARAGGLYGAVVALRARSLLREIEAEEPLTPDESLELGRRLMGSDI